MTGAGRRALLATGLAGLARPLAAQSPTDRFSLPAPRPRSISLLVGAPGGSAADRWVRGFAPFLERHLPRVGVTVANRVGDGGLTAIRELAESPADGTVLGYAATPFILARMVERDATGLLGKLRLVGAVTEEPVVLVAVPGTEITALTGRGRASPDRPLALPPPSSAAAHAATQVEAELPLSQLHFPSAGAARMATLAGNAAAAFLTLPECIVALRDGRLVALGVATAERTPLLPDVPTLTETGVPLVASVQRGFALPAGAVRDVVDEMAGALRASTADPEFAAQSETFGAAPRALGSRGWGEVIARDLASLRLRWETAPWPVSRG
ncbi:tripartite tricarboxylate transporter substrate-binding protein [Muricoccus radiodurans]|uniref:tripartite tricarboxylate transporter substrate-binding protein n=1 Tax=Muricoccus radiodurans TaxID=2231721 RepID=UPI003CF153F7